MYNLIVAKWVKGLEFGKISERGGWLAIEYVSRWEMARGWCFGRIGGVWNNPYVCGVSQKQGSEGAFGLVFLQSEQRVWS